MDEFDVGVRMKRLWGNALVHDRHERRCFVFRDVVSGLFALGLPLVL